MGVRLNWKGEQVTEEVLKNVAQILGEFGLRAEGHSKRELRKGHGVLTGTLRRSIHIAQPGYDWASDAAIVTIKGKRENGSSYTLGGSQTEGRIEGSRVTLQLGSGLNYALPVHQGHHSFQGYHFLTNGVNKAKPELPAIIKKYRMRK